MRLRQGQRTLRAEHFFDALHGRIYAASGKLIERGAVANHNHAGRPIRADPRWPIRGRQVFARLRPPWSDFNATDYADVVRELWMREVIAAARTSLRRQPIPTAHRRKWRGP